MGDQVHSPLRFFFDWTMAQLPFLDLSHECLSRHTASVVDEEDDDIGALFGKKNVAPSQSKFDRKYIQLRMEKIRLEDKRDQEVQKGQNAKQVKIETLDGKIKNVNDDIWFLKNLEGNKKFYMAYKDRYPNRAM